MPTNDNIVTWYYCHNCGKDTKAELAVYIVEVLNLTKHVKIECVARCLECGNELQFDEDFMNM